jgi:hypothetical protein
MTMGCMGRDSVKHDHLISRARLEQYMDAARQLRSETVASRIRQSDPLAGIKILLRRLAALLSNLMPGRA